MALNNETKNWSMFSLIDLAFILLLIQIISSNEESIKLNRTNIVEKGKFEDRINVCMNNSHMWIFNADGKELLSKIKYCDQRYYRFNKNCVDKLKAIMDNEKRINNKFSIKIADGTYFWGPYRILTLMKDSCGFQDEILIENL